MKRKFWSLSLAATILAPLFGSPVYASSGEEVTPNSSIESSFKQLKVNHLESVSLEEQEKLAEESERMFREYPRVFNEDIEKYIQDPELLKKAKEISRIENERNPVPLNIKSMSQEELQKAAAAGIVFLPYQFTFDIKLQTSESSAQRFQPGASTIVVYASSQEFDGPGADSIYWIDIYKDGVVKKLLGRAYFSRNTGGTAQVNYYTGAETGASYFMVVGKVGDDTRIKGYGTAKNPG